MYIYKQKYRVAVWSTQKQSYNQHHNINKVMSVTSGKHSAHDTEPACFVIFTTLETSHDALYSMEYLNTQNRRNVPPVLSVGIVWRISGQCGHHTAGLSRSDVCHLVIQKQQSVR